MRYSRPWCGGCLAFIREAQCVRGCGSRPCSPSISRDPEESDAVVASRGAGMSPEASTTAASGGAGRFAGPTVDPESATAVMTDETTVLPPQRTEGDTAPRARDLTAAPTL